MSSSNGNHPRENTNGLRPVHNANPEANPDANPEASAPAERPMIGITMGDPAGIGAEVVVKALADPDVRASGRFVIFGVEDILARAAHRCGIKPYWFCMPSEEVGRIDSGVLVADFDTCNDVSYSEPQATPEGGRASLGFVDSAVDAHRRGIIDAVVTGPINKSAWKSAGCRFPGHTEKLADAFKVRRCTMMFAAGEMRVALASIHVGLFELRNRFTIGLVFQPIDLLASALREWFGVAYPRIAVAGLNPHAGEGGQFGDEEARVIEPAMQMARNAGIDVEGPFAADTLFTPDFRRRFDGIVAMYHDQGLIPVKMLAFDHAVNVTLGLPMIRTSVDHGTAYDIAGRNMANPGSMKAAVLLACQMANHRKSDPADLPRVTVTGG